MKFVNFCQNLPDDKHCLQACLKMAAEYFLPKKFYIKEMDKEISPSEEWAWFPSGVIWLNNLSLKTKLYSPFDYKEFSEKGEIYLKNFWSQDIYNYQKANNCLNDLLFVQKKSQEMVNKNLWENKRINDFELSVELQSNNCLAIGKTQGHYMLIIQKDNFGKWEIHDPGTPPIPNRIFNTTIENIFGDILIIKNK